MDMDGTLLNHKNEILQETKDALIQAQKQGILLVLASGRSYPKLLPYALELEMQQYGGFLIEVNGMALYDIKNNKRHVYERMKQEHVRELFSYFKQFKVEIMASIDEGLYDYNPSSIMEEKRIYRMEHQLPVDFPWTGGAFMFLADNRRGYPNIQYIQKDDEIKEDINKIAVTYHEEVIDKVSKQARMDLKDRYWVGRTTKRWLEVMLPGITKGNGVLKLAKKLSIKADEIIAFGDGENDIEMLQTVKYGIAMENALENVKEIAMDITDSNECNGIAKALYKYLNMKR